MTNTAIATAIEKLKLEHIRLCQELGRVDEALVALGGSAATAAKKKPGRPPKSAVKSMEVADKAVGRKTKAVTGKRTVSPAARKRMAEAARKRWAAIRTDKNKQTASKA